MNKNMIKGVALVALLMGGLQTAGAQEEAPKYHLGVRIGYAETNIARDFHLDDHSEYNCQSFMAGISFDAKLIKKPLYLETGLYGYNRGVDVRDGSHRYAEKNFSLQVPVMLSYHFYPGDNFSIRPFTGPYVAYSTGFKNMDYGWRLGCGFNYKQLCFDLGVDLGLKNNVFYNTYMKQTEDNLSTLYVTVGWNFLGKK